MNGSGVNSASNPLGLAVRVRIGPSSADVGALAQVPPEGTSSGGTATPPPAPGGPGGRGGLSGGAAPASPRVLLSPTGRGDVARPAPRPGRGVAARGRG